MARKHDLVGLAEIAELLSVARNTAWRWSQRADFPTPAIEFAMGKAWERREVVAWAKQHRAR
jgi:predicted DNA-binding transcriptional regulator AlpA